MLSLKSLSDYPKEAKYLLIKFSVQSIYHEGDERSRSNPGHGYPAYTETLHTSEVFAFMDQSSLEVELQRLYTENRTRTDLLVVEINRQVNIKATISLSLG